MTTEFKFPDVGEGIHEGQLVKWLVKEGDTVKADQSIAEVETDKAIVEIPCPEAGTILKLHAKEGAIIKVGEILVTIGKKGEKLPEAKIVETAGKEGKPEKKIERKIPAVEEKPKEESILATIAVRKLAEQLKVDLAQVHGTGFGGRITEEDVQKAAQRPPSKLAPKISFSKFGRILEVPASHIRKQISERMVISKQRAPHVTHMDEADITELIKVRKKEKEVAKNKGVNLTYLPFIIKAVCVALQKFPYMNASLDEEKDMIVVKNYYNIGVAVDTADGLIVPNIKNADKKSIMELAKETETLIEKTKERKLAIEDLQGGTFTITNVGAIGGIFFTPILNYPEVGILGIGRFAEKPKVFEGKIQIRSILPLSITYDHRVVDGALAANCMNEIKKHLEDPDLLLVDQS